MRVTKTLARGCPAILLWAIALGLAGGCEEQAKVSAGNASPAAEHENPLLKTDESPADADLAKSYLDKGVKALSLNDLDEAIYDLDQAIGLQSRNGWAYLLRGNAWSRKPNYAQAAADFDKAAEFQADLHEYYLLWSYCHLQAGAFDKAVECATRALDQNANRYGALTLRADAYTRQKKIDQALADLAQAVQLKPDDPQAYRQRAPIYIQRGQSNLAMLDLTKLISLGAGSAAVYRSRAAIYYDHRMDKEALDDCNHALAADPRDAWAYMVRGEARLNLKDYPAAIDDLTRAIELIPNNALIYLDRGNAYLLARKFAPAIEDFTRVIALLPKDSRGYYNRGLARRDQGQLDQAVADITAALERTSDPKRQALMRFRLAQTYWDYRNSSLLFDQKRKKIMLAIRELREARIANPQQMEAPSLLCDILWEIHAPPQEFLLQTASMQTMFSKNAEFFFRRAEMRSQIALQIRTRPEGREAIRLTIADYGSAISIDPHKDKYWGRLSFFMETVDTGNPEEVLRNAIQANPNCTELYNALIRYYRRKNLPLEAQAWTEKAIKAMPANSDAYLLLAQQNFAYNKLADAQHALQRALEINPHNVDALKLVSVVYLFQNRLTQAVRSARQAMDEFNRQCPPDSENAKKIEAVNARIELCSLLGNMLINAVPATPRDQVPFMLDEAAKLRNQLADLNQAQSPVYIKLSGRLMLAQGHPSEAAILLEQADKAYQKTDLETFLSLIDAYYRLDRPTDALTRVNEFLARPGKSHETAALIMKARILLRLGDFDEAKQCLKTVLADNYFNTEARDLLESLPKLQAATQPKKSPEPPAPTSQELY